MKKLIIFSFFLLSSHLCLFAGTIDFYQNTGISQSGMSWSKTNAVVCSDNTSSFLHFYCTYSNTTHSVCGNPNPYRITFRLYRDGIQVGDEVSQIRSSPSTGNSFLNVAKIPGTYYTIVQFERKPCFGSWYPAETITSNSIVVTANVNPKFTIKYKNGSGITVTSPVAEFGQTKTPFFAVCGSNITMDAAVTTCENNYNVGVWEVSMSGVRSREYEWNRFFNGQAINNISIQSLATNITSPDFTYLGFDTTRKGNVLTGGVLSNGSGNPSYPSGIATTPRYFMVQLCNGESGYKCAQMSIQVMNCSANVSNNNDLEVSDLSNAKYREDANSSSNIKNIEESHKIYPNPVGDELNIRYNTLKGGRANLSIFDLNGNSLIKDSQSFEKGTNEYKVDVSNLPIGMYFYNLQADRLLNGKFIKK